MAAPTINFAGFVYDDSGDAVSGATIHIYDKNSTTTAREATSVTTNSDGYYSYSHATPGEFDVEIIKGTSKRRYKFDDKIHLSEIDVEKLSIRGNEGAISGLYMYADEGDDVTDQWLIDVGTDGVLAFGNDAASQGSFVDQVTFTPNSTVTSGTVAVKGNLTVGNALTVTGTTTLNGSLVLGDAAADTLTIGATLQGASPLVFEGATSGDFETTFAITDPTADRTITFPDLTGTVQISGHPISGTTIDASTDFTIGTTVITDDVITFTPTASDTVTMTAATNGAFSLVTVDAAAAAANIQITADGTVDIDSAGVLTLDSGAAINIEPATGSAILLDGTISIDAGVVTGATSITSTNFVGTVTTATQNSITTMTGLVTTSALNSGSITSGFGNINNGSSTITTTGAADLGATTVDSLTSTGTVTGGSDGSGVDVVLYSGTAGDNLTWDASEEVLQITGTDGATSLDVLDGDVRVVDKLYFYDRGGEYLSSDGSTLSITGTTTINGATTINQHLTVGATTTGNNRYATFLTDDGYASGIVMGNNADADRAWIKYYGADDSPADLLEIKTTGSAHSRFQVASNVSKIDFQGSSGAELITSAGDLVLSPAGGVDLGANTLTSTGSMQIRTIDYSDGDLAMTIADGGGVTFAQVATFPALNANSIEVRWDGNSPFIDFSNDTGSDYDARVQLVSDDLLGIFGAELGVAQISYTDGDNAMTIADGGGVTFAQDLATQNINIVADGYISFGDTNHLIDVNTGYMLFKMPANEDFYWQQGSTNTMYLDTSEESLILESLGTGADEGPELHLKSNSSSPTDNDKFGKIKFIAEDTASNALTYAQIYARTQDVTESTIDGRLDIETYLNGTSYITAGFWNNDLHLIRHLEMSYDASAQDSMIWWDGNEIDLHIGLDDSANELSMGVGTVLGTTTGITIGKVPSSILTTATIGIGRSSGINNLVAIRPGATLTAANAEASMIYSEQGTINWTNASGGDATVAIQSAMALRTQAWAGASNTLTFTEAATLWIEGAPTDSDANVTITNPYALWVDSGTSRFDGAVDVYGLLSAGAFASTGDAAIEIGRGRNGSGNAYIDLVTDASTYTDYGFRIIKGSGANGNTSIVHRGTGALYIITDEAASTIFQNNSSETLRIRDNGSIYINDSDNGKMTVGLTINQASNDDEVLAFKSADVAHNLTTATETDTYGYFKKLSAGAGGLEMVGHTDDFEAIHIKGVMKDSANTNKDSTAEAIVTVSGYAPYGTTDAGNPDDNSNIFLVTDAGNPRFLVDEDGDLHYDGSTATFDSYNDAELVRAFDIAQGSEDLIKNKFDDFISYNEQTLIDTGILGAPVKDGGLVNLTGLQRLHNGALWQAHVERKELESKVEKLESRLLALEGA